MTELDEYVPSVHDRLTRKWTGYYPNRETTETLTHSFEMDIINTLLNAGYTKKLSSKPYCHEGRKCIDVTWVNEPINMVIKVTRYRENGKEWFFLKFDGLGSRAYNIWLQLKELEDAVLDQISWA